MPFSTRLKTLLPSETSSHVGTWRPGEGDKRGWYFLNGWRECVTLAKIKTYLWIFFIFPPSLVLVKGETSSLLWWAKITAKNKGYIIKLWLTHCKVYYCVFENICQLNCPSFFQVETLLYSRMQHLPIWLEIVFLTVIYSFNSLRNDLFHNSFILFFLSTSTRTASPQAMSVLKIFTTVLGKGLFFVCVNLDEGLIFAVG